MITEITTIPEFEIRRMLADKLDVMIPQIELKDNNGQIEAIIRRKHETIDNNALLQHGGVHKGPVG